MTRRCLSYVPNFYTVKELLFFCTVWVALVACEDRNIDGCGGQPPPAFRALVYGEDNRNVLSNQSEVLFYTIRDGIQYSERYYQITDVGDSSQTGLYSDFLSASDQSTTNTYYLEIDGDVDTLQVEVVEKTDVDNGCKYLDYGSVQFNGRSATFYPWTTGGGYLLER